MFDSSLKCSKLSLMRFWGPGNGQDRTKLCLRLRRAVINEAK
jgi:hypothetical protein